MTKDVFEALSEDYDFELELPIFLHKDENVLCKFKKDVLILAKKLNLKLEDGNGNITEEY